MRLDVREADREVYAYYLAEEIDAVNKALEPYYARGFQAFLFKSGDGDLREIIEKLLLNHLSL